MEKSECSPNPQVAVLFLCHRVDRAIAKEFVRISAAVRGTTTPLLLFHKKPDNGLSGAPAFPLYAFTDESLATLPYQPVLKGQVVPGNTHFPLMQFFRDFPNYEYYWLIEGDVRFSGKWKRLFNAFVSSDADFLACQIRRYQEDPGWYWWPYLSHSGKEVPSAERLTSFNPIYRISRRALECLHQGHRDGWQGHFEALIPTLLLREGYRLRDFGGTGAFVMPGDENRFYTKDTMRFRPCFQKIGWKWNKLYHPVKTL